MSTALSGITGQPYPYKYFVWEFMNNIHLFSLHVEIKVL